MNKQQIKIVRGTILSLLVPFVGLIIFYFIRFTEHSLSEYISSLITFNLIAPVISVSLVPNVLLFFFFVNRDRYKEGQGVILAMLLWGLMVVYFKFL